MNEWPQVTLAEISAKPQYGAIAKGSAEPDGPLFVRQTDIASGRIDWTSVPFCDLAAPEFDKYALHAGDLLISRLGNGVGNAATVREPHGAVFAGYLVRFRARMATAVPEFLGYQLQSKAWRQHVAGFRSGAAQPTLNAQQMGEFQFRLPPIEKQRGIAATLGALDDKIESNRSAIEIAGDLLDALGVALADTLASVPLAGLIKVKRVAVDPTSLGDAQVDHFSLPAFDEGARPERVAASTIMSSKLAVTKPSILVSRLNPRFNRTWWAVPTEGVPALASTEFACLTTDTREELAAVWLGVRDEYFRGEVVRRASGTSGSHQRVRPEDLLAIDVPDVRELSPYAKIEALALLDLIHGHRTESVKLAQLRDALLPELLSGTIRVPECREAVEEAVG